MRRRRTSIEEIYMNTITDPNRVGDISEYKAMSWLLSDGYDVFKNAACTGSTDIIAIKDNDIIKIDVKTACILARDGELHLVQKQSQSSDIKVLYVFKDTCSFKLGDLTPLIDDNDYTKFKDILASQTARLFETDLTG